MKNKTTKQIQLLSKIIEICNNNNNLITIQTGDGVKRFVKVIDIDSNVTLTKITATIISVSVDNTNMKITYPINIISDVE